MPYARTVHMRLTAVAFLTMLLVVTACSGPPPSDPDQEASALNRFYTQELVFGACDEFATNPTDEQVFAAATEAECSYLEVPVDYEHPGGKTAQVAVLRMPSGEDATGSLVVNPGGPGGAGLVQGAATSVTLEGTAVPETFDIVGFDPRGVGASQPAIDCVSDADADAGANTFPQAAIQGAATAEETTSVYEGCVEGTGDADLLEHIGTRDVARDLDILRAALGDEELTYMGQSYGTRLGAVYAEMFPQNVRAMVLDGAVDPSLGTAEWRLTQYVGFQQAFDEMAAACAEQADCVLGADPDQATERFQEIVRPLIEDPVPTAEGRDVDFNTAVGGVLSGLYDSSQWPAVLAGIAELEQGSGDTLLALGDAFGGRQADGTWSNYLEANHAINCLDEERRTPAEEETLRAEIFAQAPLMDPGEGAEGARDGCEAWPVEPNLDYPYATDIEGMPETLTVSITGDPSTPYEGGAALAKTLDGSLLTVEANQHTIAMSGTDPCVNDIVAAYLVNLTTPEEGATCTP